MKCEACLNAWLSALKTVCFLFFFFFKSKPQPVNDGVQNPKTSVGINSGRTDSERACCIIRPRNFQEQIGIGVTEFKKKSSLETFCSFRFAE